MDIQNLTIDDLSSNPELLEEIKAELHSAQGFKAIAKQKLDSFISDNFHQAADAKSLIGDLKPSLDAEMNLVFLDKHGIDTDAESFLISIRSSQRSYYLKPIEQEKGTPARSDAKMPKDNPWAKGSENRTKQLIFTRDLPPETVAKMKREAGAKV
jgi:hypothetical protein